MEVIQTLPDNPNLDCLELY
ncbi:hypothetical protein [Okeanomitos corallinicola]